MDTFKRKIYVRTHVYVFPRMKKKQQRKGRSGSLMKITDGKLLVKDQETTQQQKGLDHQDIQAGMWQAESE